MLLFGNIGLFVLSRFHAFPFRALPPHAPCPAYGPHCPLNKPQAPISQMHLLFRPRISFLGPDTNHKNQSPTQHHVLSAHRLRQPGFFSGFLLIDYVNLNISDIPTKAHEDTHKIQELAQAYYGTEGGAS